MKTLILILFIIYFTGTSAQLTKIDSLITEIHNTQLRAYRPLPGSPPHYVLSLEMSSEAGWELTKIGRPATNYLIGKLTDQHKGIIAHFILTNIWMDTVRQRNSYVYFNRDSSGHYSYNGLALYETNLYFFARQHDLDDIKRKWLNILVKNSRFHAFWHKMLITKLINTFRN